MASTVEVITLSSSPNNERRASLHRESEGPFELPTICRYMPKGLHPTQLVQAPNRSKYFLAEPSKSSESPTNAAMQAETRFEKTNPTITATSNCAVVEKLKRTKKKSSTKSQPASRSTESGDHTRETIPEKKPRKRQITRSGSEVQSKILTGKVGKAGCTQMTTSGEKATMPVSLETPPGQKSTKMAADDEGDSLNLEEAVKRRLDWTPPEEQDRLQASHATESPSGSPSRHDLANLFSDYGYNGVKCVHEDPRPANDGSAKRRRVELIQANIPSLVNTVSRDSRNDRMTDRSERHASMLKNEPQLRDCRKKTTTLTARMTACYLADRISTSHDSRHINTIFTTGNEGPETGDNSIAFAKRTSKKSQKKNTAKHTVLSPEAAVKYLRKQDLVFGTCSQLVLDNSPTTLRAKEAGVHASDECEFQPRSSNITESIATAAMSPTTVRSRFGGSKKLWHVAARDAAGDVVKADVIDLTMTPDASPYPAESQIEVDQQVDSEIPAATSEVVDAFQIGLAVPDVGLNQLTVDTCSKDLQPSTKISSMNEGSSEKPDGLTYKEAPAQVPKMPNYNDFTDVRLMQQIIDFGFKPIRNRKMMIGLLEKCWEAQHGNEAQEPAGIEKNTKQIDSTTAETDQTAVKINDIASNLKQSRTRSLASATARSKTSKLSKKTAKSKSVRGANPERAVTPNDIEEIEDSGDELIPSPSRVQRHYSLPSRASSNQPLETSTAPSTIRYTRASPQDLAASTTTNALEQSMPDLPDMAQQITKAVRAQPRLYAGLTQKKISWHEKILIYDPIVLEDFAAWLNTEGLGLIDEDREVSAGFLREWCESKGICCCWKGAIRREH